MADDDDEVLEQTLLIVKDVQAYRVPPRSSSGGWRCSEWRVSDKFWSGRLRVISKGEVCEIRLEDPKNGDLFVCCPISGGNREAAVEPATDSSRYFVIRVDDGRGRHAFIGLGFNERNEAFDFNVALSDHEKHLAREKEQEKEEGGDDVGHHSRLDLKLKEGETIRINMKAKVPEPSGGKKLVPLSAGGRAVGVGGTGAMLAPLAPPPGGYRLREPLPSPNGPKDAAAVSTAKETFTAPAGEGARNGTSKTATAGKVPKNIPATTSVSSSSSSGSGGGGSANTNVATGWASF